MAQPFFAASNRLATVFGGAVYAQSEFEMTVALNPQVSFQDILDMLDEDRAALWLDRECVITDARCCESFHHRRIEIITVRRYYRFALSQVPGTNEHRAPVPPLEYFLTRLTYDDGVKSFWIQNCNVPNLAERTLDVSQACFSNLLQTSRLHNGEAVYCAKLEDMSLTAEQTALLFTHDTSQIFINLNRCRFHGPTLLQCGSAALLQREQTHALGRGSYLEITLGDQEIVSISRDELTALLSNPHIRSFRPFSGAGVSYENVKKFVSALASNQISTLERLDLFSYTDAKIEWEKEDEPSAWIDMWKAIGQHPSLKEIHFGALLILNQQSWWQPKPIAEAVKVNPPLVHVGLRDNISGRPRQNMLDEHVKPLLERNRYRPKIAASCCTDPSKAAVLLGQAIVAISRKKNAKSRHELHRMLLLQLVLTGYDFGARSSISGGDEAEKEEE